MNENPVRAFVAGSGDYRWDRVELLRYKEEGSAPFRDELRYFEIAPAGFSTLERHEHAHAVMILRGAGQVLVGDQVLPVHTFDLVTVPPLTWHQFRAASASPLGFLCMVDAERDKSQLPSARDVEELRASPAVARFLSAGAY